MFCDRWLPIVPFEGNNLIKCEFCGLTYLFESGILTGYIPKYEFEIKIIPTGMILVIGEKRER